jgi:excisionase family DNA binding protein
MVPPGHDDASRAASTPDESNDTARDEPEELLTPSEVAAMFRVNPKTVTRWHRTGKVSAIRTLGGHRRFRASEIRRLLAEGEQ